MSNQIDKYNIKIPKDVSVIYSEKKKILTFSGPLKTKSMKLKIKVYIDQLKNIISVSPLTFYQISNKEKKKIKALRNSTVAQIEHMLIESSILLYRKLKINGVGYRAEMGENFAKKLLTLKLGYSHLVYIKTPKDLTMDCFTKTKLCIFGNSYNNISSLAALIRANKTPEPYKGKGVLYEDETIALKEGKKI